MIADWIHPKSKYDLSIFPVCETKDSYLTVLHKTGFTEITFRDDSMIFVGYVQAFIENLAAQQKYILNKYGMAIYSIIQSDHKKLIDEIKQKQKIAVEGVFKLFCQL